MLKTHRHSTIQNNKGMAVFEMIPIILVIVLLINFSLGFFGAIHTGILNSMSARNYAFETFRNRSNLNYFKNTDPSAESVKISYTKVGMRLHGSVSEKINGKDWSATARSIDFLSFGEKALEQTGTDQATHGKTREVSSERNTTVGVNPIWIKTAYGICITAACGS